MEEYLRFGLLLLGALILFLIVLESVMRRRRLKSAAFSASDLNYSAVSRTVQLEPSCAINLPVTEEPMKITQQTQHSEPLDKAENFIVLSVFAKPNSHFASYDLLQAISATGMQYGEMSIFHYYLDTEAGRVTLFSLASATKPGVFNLDRIGDFSCLGLTLFMDLSSAIEPEFAFNKMLATAEQLAEDLDGDLYAGPRKPLTSEVLQQYRQRIEQYRFVKN